MSLKEKLLEMYKKDIGDTIERVELSFCKQFNFDECCVDVKQTGKGVYEIKVDDVVITTYILPEMGASYYYRGDFNFPIKNKKELANAIYWKDNKYDGSK